LGKVRTLPKILIAEDEPEILRIYKILLEDEGYQVFTAINGKECLDAYKTELDKMADNRPPFDLVLLDHRMPEKSGAEVAKEILALCPTQRLLMVTAYPDHYELQDKKLKNEMQVIQKPFDPDELLKTISKLVST
jgi:two-component system cell cycle response regulator CpdR